MIILGLFWTNDWLRIHVHVDNTPKDILPPLSSSPLKTLEVLCIFLLSLNIFKKLPLPVNHVKLYNSSDQKDENVFAGSPVTTDRCTKMTTMSATYNLTKQLFDWILICEWIWQLTSGTHSVVCVFEKGSFLAVHICVERVWKNVWST